MSKVISLSSGGLISTPWVKDGGNPSALRFWPSCDMKLQRHHLVVGGWWCIATVDMGMWALSCMYTPRVTMFMFEHTMCMFEHVMRMFEHVMRMFEHAMRMFEHSCALVPYAHAMGRHADLVDFKSPQVQ